ncbi:MAG: DUF2948 family protein [Alphaproteobacteria bacterium]|nr:DUF2948 family protein [Alphaproteobacteria bacterium]
MTELKFSPLRLLAKDKEEIHILSAQLQDGFLPLTSVHFDKDAKTFTCLINRFCWEYLDAHPNEERYYRVHSGFSVSNVLSVHKRNFDQKHPLRVLNLLMISVDEPKKGRQTIHLLFSGDKEIRLEVESIHCQLGDIDHPWHTSKKPIHIHEHLEELEKKRA